MPKVVIVGAGLTGLSAAYHLGKSGYECSVYEKEKQAGGLCRTNQESGYYFDFAGHWFHCRTDYVKSLLDTLMPGELGKVNRNTAIYMLNRYLQHPFQTNLKGLPDEKIIECLVDFSKAYYSYIDQEQFDNFEDWILKTLGDGIAKYFMIPYNQKLWNVDLKTMTCEWMGRFLPRVDIRDVFYGAINNEKSEGYNASFIYPQQGGIQSLINAFEKKVGNIFFQSTLEQVDVQKKELYFSNGEVANYDILISTVPLVELISIISNKSTRLVEDKNKLKYTSIYNLNLGVKGTVIPEKHWIYYPEADIPFFRMGSYSNAMASMAPPKNSSLYIEVAYSTDRKIDQKAVQDQCIRQLINLGIIEDLDQIEVFQCNNMKYAYVIYDQNYRSTSSSLIDYLKENNIYSIGRYGGWNYSSMEDAILDGVNVVKEIGLGRGDW